MTPPGGSFLVRRSGTLCPRCTLSSAATRPQKLRPLISWWFHAVNTRGVQPPPAAQPPNPSNQKEKETGRRQEKVSQQESQLHSTIPNQQTEKKPEPPTTSRTGVATVGFGDMAPVTSQDTEWGAVTDCLGHPRQVLSLSYCKS